MRAAGEQCKLYFDTTLTVDEGDVIETPTGRRYLVLAARRSPTKPRRWNMDVMVMADDEVEPEGSEVHRMWWYRRRKRG